MELLEKESLKLITECYKKFESDEICVAFNGGKDNMVMLYLLSKYLSQHLIDIPKCFYFKLNDEFLEMLTFINEINNKYQLSLEMCGENIKEELKTIKEKYPKLKAILMANRRTDPYCERLNYFHKTDGDYPEFIRVNPILDWNYQDIWNYTLENNIPYCELYLKGYTSIGNMKNTVPNKYLKIKSSDQYEPAWKLKYSELERYGRR